MVTKSVVVSCCVVVDVTVEAGSVVVSTSVDVVVMVCAVSKG